MRRYASKVEIISLSGGHVRYCPGDLAAAMVDSGVACIAHANGRIRSIKLVQTATSHAVRIGEPTPLTGLSCTRFTFRERLNDSGTRVWAHHPRSLEYWPGREKG